MPYPSVADVRLLEPDVADELRFPPPALETHLAAAIESIERITQRAFQPTVRVERTRVDCDGRIWLERGSKQHQLQSIDSITVGTLAAQLVVLDDGELIGGSWAPQTLLTITYTHGLTVTPPDIIEVVAMATRLAAQRPKSAVPDKADRFVVGGDSRTYFLDVPGLRKLGVRSIDAIISRYSLHHGLAI